MGSSYHRIFLKLKFHFIKNKNELSCFYTLCQACFPPSLSLHWRHHKPPPPHSIRRPGFSDSLQIESACFLEALSPSVFPQVPSSLFLEFLNAQLSLCLPALCPFPEGHIHASQSKNLGSVYSQCAPRMWTATCLSILDDIFPTPFLCSPAWELIRRMWKFSSGYNWLCFAQRRRYWPIGCI